MRNLILDSIKDYCDSNFNWFDNFIRCKDFEIYKDKKLKAIINFEVEVEVYHKPSYGNYNDPPERGECDFQLYEIEVLQAKNKEKLQSELNNLKGKVL